MVEFGMLSRTDFVVHSFASSFGEEAAAVRNVPSMKIRKGGNIGGIDLENTEAECGNNQLLNLRKKKKKRKGTLVGEGEVVCFVDGTGKEVCQSKITKKRCVHLEKWGINDAYC